MRYITGSNLKMQGAFPMISLGNMAHVTISLNYLINRLYFQHFN